MFTTNRIRTLYTNFRTKPICTSSKPSSLKPKTPLFLRPAKHTISLSHLTKWHQWATHLISSVGSTFLHLDNGPDSTNLHSELKWLMEDLFDDPLQISQLGISHNSTSVTVKASLDELYELWSERIEKRRPFQYVVGCEHWRDLVLCVQEGVLIPRPETEIIVDLVNDVVRGSEDLRDGLWADLGTGSGAVAIGIERILGSGSRVFATDLSNVAVSVAKFNVQRYDLQGKIEVREGSWFEPLKDVEGKLSGLVSNPPYIPSENIPGLQAEVGRHEPILALDGGQTGLDDLLHLVDGASSMLKPGGYFAFETNGEKHCKFLVDYIKNEHPGRFCNVNVVSDFAGIKRFITGFRQ